MSVVLAVLAAAVLIAVFVIGREVYRKNMHIWLWSYIIRKPEVPLPGEPVHIMFAFVDHFEPRWGRASPSVEDARVDRWCKEYPVLADQHQDADGCHPKHTFFFPQEEYEQRHLAKLSSLCSAGYGEIEIHLHHDNDTARGLSSKLVSFLETLDREHRAVARDPKTNAFRFSFIHGNWALDNSRADGRWCGVDNELAVLGQLGCYADFTLPSAPSDTQTRKINSIYYATGRDGRRKSHNTGTDVEAGKPGKGDLMIIQGPLALNWKYRKYSILPRIENSDIRKNSPPTHERVDLWVKAGIGVKKKPNWRFVKIHTHGTQEGDIDTLLGEPVDAMFSYLESKYNDGRKYILHYVSAREMYNIVVAAEAGETGDPNEYRDYRIPRPPMLDAMEPRS